MRGHNLLYLFKEGLRSIFTHGTMSLASVTVIMACLLITGSFSMLAYNVGLAIDNAANNNELLAFVGESLSDDEARALEGELTQLDNVSQVIFVPREQAFDEYSQELGEDSYLLDGLEDEDILRHRYRVFLTDISLTQTTVEELKQLPGIERVNASLEISDGIVALRKVIYIICYLLAAILIFISMFIISNTLRLATFTRREEIAIMRMVGATNAFIRLPFVVEGFLLGVVGGGLAYLAQWGLYSYTVEKVQELMPMLRPVSFDSISLLMLASFLGLGFLIGVFGSVMMIRKYLRA